LHLIIIKPIILIDIKIAYSSVEKLRVSYPGKILFLVYESILFKDQLHLVCPVELILFSVADRPIQRDGREGESSIQKGWLR